MERFETILLFLIGLFIGATIATVAVSNSFAHKIHNYEALIERVSLDMPGYVDNVLCETDEWSNVYDH